jgi:hypothetical protein
MADKSAFYREHYLQKQEQDKFETKKNSKYETEKTRHFRNQEYGKKLNGYLQSQYAEHGHSQEYQLSNVAERHLERFNMSNSPRNRNGYLSQVMPQGQFNTDANGMSRSMVISQNILEPEPFSFNQTKRERAREG